MTHVVTVATHANGMFDQLVNNTLNMDVKVLGWGQKWSGFNMKLKLFREYLEGLGDDEIAIFVDGWDVLPLQTADVAVERFKALGCDILLSRELETAGFLHDVIFGKTKDGQHCNTGMYMGRVAPLRRLLDEALSCNCKDDQRIVTKASHNHDVRVDSNCFVFRNTTPSELEHYKNAPVTARPCFVSTPGEMSVDRWLVRGSKEYLQFFIAPFLLIITAMAGFFIYRKRWPALIILLVITALLLWRMDTSCIA